MSARKPRTKVAKKGDVEAAEPKFLYKGKEIVHISNSISFLQRKLVNVLLFNAYKDLLTREVHTITSKELLTMLDLDYNNLGFLKDAFRALMNVKIEWSILDEKAQREKWEISTILSQAGIDGNICSYAYSPLVRDKLYNPQVYALIDLSIQSKFRSGYGFALYENCLRFRSEKSTQWFTIETFRKLVGASEDSSRAEFKVLNRDVIKPAVEEVNAVSNLIITAEFKRVMRRVTEIRFLIEEKQQALLDLSAEVFDEATLTRLKDFGIQERQAKSELAVHSVEYVNGVLDYVEHRITLGKVQTDNIPAYTAKALREGYMLTETKFHREKAALAQRIQAENNAADRSRRLRIEFDAFRKERFEAALNSLGESEQAVLREQFIGGLNAVDSKLYRKSDFGSIIIQQAWRIFLTPHLLKRPEEIDMGEYEKWRTKHQPASTSRMTFELID